MAGEADFNRGITETVGNQDTAVQLETSTAFFTQQNLEELVPVSKSYIEMSDTVTLVIAEKDLVFELKEEMKDMVKGEIGVSEAQEVSGSTPVLDAQMDTTAQKLTQGFSFENAFADDKQGLTANEKSQFLEGNPLEGKTQLVNSTSFDCVGQILGDTAVSMNDKSESIEMFKGRDVSGRRSLKIKVIDDTALIETFHVTKSDNGSRKEKGHVTVAKNDKKIVNHELDGKKEKRTRKRGKCVERGTEKNENPNLLVEASNGCEKIGITSKKLYSRSEMESLRFVNIQEQKKKWYEIYCGLGPVVTNEYDELPKNNHVNFDPRQQFEKFHQPSALPDTGYDNNNGIQDGHTEPANDYCVNSDGDGYYDSIHRPAFYVEGEPDFDSGPPEDGLEYLRRVRWECARIPKVKVVKMDESKVNKEQSIYMPSIPDIPKCPQHLLPSKEWEDAFLADFHHLRLDILESISEDEESESESEDSEMEEYPTLSSIQSVDSITRISMLKTLISSIETSTTLSENECAWIFALCAAVDTPIDAEMFAYLRCLLRKCASLRAEKEELDDEAIMLNILATIAGRYFGQEEAAAAAGI